MKTILIALMSFLTLNVFAQNDTIRWSQYDGVPYPYPPNHLDDAVITVSQGHPTTCEPNIEVSIGLYTPIVTIISYFDSLKTQWRAVTKFYYIPFDAAPIVFCVNYIPNNNSCQIYNNPSNEVCSILGYQDLFYCSIEDPLGVQELSISKKLIRVIDETGRDATPEPNRFYIYVYDDGSREKKMIVKD
jgi:hypothetical protein